TLGHRTAAACAMTRMYSDDAATHVHAPWPAFLIRLPVPLLVIEDDGIPRDANLLIVVCLPAPMAVQGGEPGKHRWWVKLCADAPITIRPDVMADDRYLMLGMGLSLWCFNVPGHDLLNADRSQREAVGRQNDERWIRWDMLDLSTSDERTDLMLRYL